jgi:hypothetical protein
MLEGIGQKRIYGIYKLLATYVHGSHASTWLYRRNLGAVREDGEFIDPEIWYLSLWTSWKSLQVLGPYVLEHLQATRHDFINDEEEIEAALHRLSRETAKNKT